MGKERATASYRLSAYFMAMTVADLPVTLLMPFLYMLISYWMVAWSFGFVTFILVTLIAMVGVMNGQAFGYLIGAAFDDVQIGQTVMMVVMSLLMLVGGFFNPDIPSWLVWAQYLSPFYYAGNAAMQVIFKKAIPCDGSGVYSQYCTGDETSIPAETYLQDVLKIKEPLCSTFASYFCSSSFPVSSPTSSCAGRRPANESKQQAIFSRRAKRKSNLYYMFTALELIELL